MINPTIKEYIIMNRTPDHDTRTDEAMEGLENELGELDMPQIDIAVILIVMGDAFDIDPQEFMHALQNDTLPALRASSGGRKVDLMEDMVSEAIESSTQLPHIARALEIYKGLDSLQS